MRKDFIKKRNTAKRREKPVYLLVVEGWNVTESNYFQGFQCQESNVNIKILRPNSVTDPKKMLSELRKKQKSLQLNLKKGDKLFLIADLDCDEEKAKTIRELMDKNKDVDFIISNPCFEIWFLLHFIYSTKSYNDGKQLIKELRKHIPDYEKCTDVLDILSDKTEVAIKNAEKLEKYFESIGAQWPGEECNPRTDVNRIVGKIKNNKNN